jgi:DNA-binding response OmpR family regulator
LRWARHRLSGPVDLPEGAGLGMHVLVVDDDAEIVAYLDLALSMDGHTVSQALSPRLPDPPPEGYDLALVDLLLGRHDGALVISALAAQNVPVVATTGLAPESPTVAQASLAGALAVLHKPFDLADLRACLARWGRRPAGT